MWHVSSAFREALRAGVHEYRVRVEILDTDFQPVKVIDAEDPNLALIDGAVDVDVTRGTRRTLTMSFLNTNGDFSSDSEWGGLFYVNRIIRLYRGLVVGEGIDELVPIGTFMVDKSETLVERGMSTVILTGSDLWKKFSKSQFGVPTTFTEGTTINAVIEQMCADAGVTDMSLDPLNDRTSLSKTLQRNFEFERDETRGDALLKICGDYGIEIYFNPMGQLVSRDFQNPFDREIVWSYDPSDSMAYFLRSSFNDDRLYNHAIVTGTGKVDETGELFFAEVKDTDPGSPTNITRLGDRVFRYESKLLASQEAVDKSVTSIFYRHFLLSNTINLEAICNPAIEGNDVIWVEEPQYTNTARRYLINSFDISLITSKQKMTMKHVINLAPEQS